MSTRHRFPSSQLRTSASARPRAGLGALAACAALATLCVGCLTPQERFARRIGCDPKDTVLGPTVNAPAFTRTEGSCKGVKHVCTDAPFFSGCKSGAEAKAEPQKN